jgi:hypothetical protein
MIKHSCLSKTIFNATYYHIASEVRQVATESSETVKTVNFFPCHIVLQPVNQSQCTLRKENFLSCRGQDTT